VAGFNFSTVEGNLTLNGVPMKTRAWTCPDLTPLWMPAAIRGQDRILPGANGVIAYRRRRTVTQYALDFRVCGISDMNGVIVTGSGTASGNGPEEFQQLEYNVDYLRQNLIDPRITPNADGTVPGVLTMPSGDIRTADVHVLGFTVNARVSHVLQGVLDISIPSGGFV
jgi:hypothetical protein